MKNMPWIIKVALCIIGAIAWFFVFSLCFLADPFAMMFICPLLIITPGICIGLYITKTGKYMTLCNKITELEKRIADLEKEQMVNKVLRESEGKKKD